MCKHRQPSRSFEGRDSRDVKHLESHAVMLLAAHRLHRVVAVMVESGPVGESPTIHRLFVLPTAAIACEVPETSQQRRRLVDGFIVSRSSCWS